MLTISDFSGGLWLPDQSDFALPPGALLVADNLDYLPTGGVRGRRGRVKYNATPLPGEVVSLWRHYPRAGTPATLAAFTNAGAVALRHDTIGDGTFSLLTGGTGFSAGGIFYFTNWPSKSTTFCANGIETMRAYNGVLTDMGTTPHRGPYLTVWQSHLWATDPAELNYSVYCSDTDDETVWPPENHLNVSDAQGGQIVGLRGWQDRLIILKTTGLWSFFGDIDLPVSSNLTQYSDVGCVSARSIDVCPDGILYLGRDGLYLTDGQRSVPLEVSRPIRPQFVAPATQSVNTTAVGAWYPRRGQYWISTAAGIWPISLATRLAPGGKQSWAWATYGYQLAATAFCTWDSEDEDGRLLIGTADGQVWIADTGNTDDGQPIATFVKPAARYLDPALQRTGRVYSLKVLYRGARPLVGYVEYDGSGGADVSFAVGSPLLDTKDARVTLWADLTKQGRFATVGLVNPADSYDYELYRIDLETRLHSARRWP
jgi:hypothetical protein